MEKMGVPAAALITKAYVDLAKATAARRGMPLERITFTLHPVWGKTPVELAAMIRGPDPVTGKPMMKEITDALTVPLSDEEQKTGTQRITAGAARSRGDTADNLQELFMNNGMTDYLPVILPRTEDTGDAQGDKPQ